jgi:dihydroorotate dehydrogenase electron transfer subunit
MKVTQLKAKIIVHRQVSQSCRHLEFVCRPIAASARPGQFVNIRISDTCEPLLRRPVSIHGVKGARVKIIYAVVGEGTRRLSDKKPGEYLDLIGPLGNGFDYPSPVKSTSGKYILLAGGMGVAPLVFLAEKLKLHKPLVLIGARSKAQLLCRQEFISLDCPVKVATEDGSVGFKGRVTDLLKKVAPEIKIAGLFSCGPHPMLKSVAEFAVENKINAQLSLEEHMSCGVGACLGCVVQTRQGYKTVCKDGPVFLSRELIW